MFRSGSTGGCHSAESEILGKNEVSGSIPDVGDRSRLRVRKAAVIAQGVAACPVTAHEHGRVAMTMASVRWAPPRPARGPSPPRAHLIATESASVWLRLAAPRRTGCRPTQPDGRIAAPPPGSWPWLARDSASTGQVNRRPTLGRCPRPAGPLCARARRPAGCEIAKRESQGLLKSFARRRRVASLAGMLPGAFCCLSYRSRILTSSSSRF